MGQNTWLAYWSQQTSAAVEQHQPLHESFYLGLYAALALAAILLQCIRSYTCAFCMTPSSRFCQLQGLALAIDER